MSRRQPTRMSLEQTLEQERRDILDALGEGSTSLQFRANRASYTPSTRHGSMQLDHHTHLPAPGTSLPPRHGSIAGIGVGITPPAQPYPAEIASTGGGGGTGTGSGSASNHNHGLSLNRRSWTGPVLSSPLRRSSLSLSARGLHEHDDDPETTASTASAAPHRRPDSTDRFKPLLGQVGRMAAASSSAVGGGTGAGEASASSPTMSTAAGSPTQQQEKQKRPKSAMMSGFDLKAGLPGFSRGRDSSVRRSTSRGSSLDSRVPSRLARSMSPRNSWLQPNPLSLATSPLKSSNKLITEKGKVIDMDSAYKHLSDATLAKLPGSTKPGSRRGSMDGGGSTTSAGDERLEKDMYDSENNPLSESSDDEEFDDESSSSDGESIRGRKVSIEVLPPSEDAAAAAAKDKDGEAKEDDNSANEAPENPADSVPDSTESTVDTTTEESTTENTQTNTPDEPPKPTVIHSAKRGPQFLNEPSPPKPPKPQVHPRTSYEAGSAANTPFGSEDEAELSDIKRAQKLSIQMSGTNNSVHNRSIRTIVRGDYANVMEETGGGRRRRRKYMVTTDLSEESVYALEWTIGTILRDGDTLFAVCAMYEENASGPSMQVGESAKAMEDSAAIVGSQTEETAQKSSHLNDTSYLPRTLLGRFGQGTDSKNSSVDSRALSKAESDRARAVETISQTCVRLLRKTLLQVRIAVEIIHCKSPKHIITEAIDKLEPTLVIVGARGRSALKGVLLGSFSNYLVTHSSVPVMVARRKLKKQTKKNKTRIRLSNNLTTPKSLALAKVD